MAPDRNRDDPDHGGFPALAPGLPGLAHDPAEDDHMRRIREQGGANLPISVLLGLLLTMGRFIYMCLAASDRIILVGAGRRDPPGA